MTMFKPSGNPINDAMQLRGQGLSDDLVADEMMKNGYHPEQVNAALSEPVTSQQVQPQSQQAMPPPSNTPQQRAAPDENIYERIEQITESMIDEKWDELIGEVKKIVEWKEKIEKKQAEISSDLQKLKEDFKTLHQGVLGKIEDYDKRMQDVGTELNAVGKVFKDVVPEFVENVKELRDITRSQRKK
jgi:hypothetical protein